jgi:hypothetical protein
MDFTVAFICSRFVIILQIHIIKHPRWFSDEVIPHTTRVLGLHIL